MATWGVHLRIAERLLNYFENIDEEYFIIGNIGPDCGIPNEERHSFDPPKEITHHYDDNRKIDYERFYKKYLVGRTLDIKTKSYLMGYYTHLITDYMYTPFYKEILDDHVRENLSSDNTFIYKLKEDWYDVDHKYFRDNPKNIFSEVFCKIKEFNDLLDYFPKGATMAQINFIKNYYNNPDENKSGDLDREYTYYTSKNADEFIELAVNKIVDCIEEKI